MASLRALLMVIRAFFRSLRAGEESGVEDTPAHLRWWEAPEHTATEQEGVGLCGQCKEPLSRSLVKQCPDCGLVLHAFCYDDTEGGHGYRTQGCGSCFHRTHWR